MVWRVQHISDMHSKFALRQHTRLAENTGRKNDAKTGHLGTIAQLCPAISSQLRHVSTIGKKLVKQQYLPDTSLQYGELWPTSG